MAQPPGPQTPSPDTDHWGRGAWIVKEGGVGVGGTSSQGGRREVGGQGCVTGVQVQKGRGLYLRCVPDSWCTGAAAGRGSGGEGVGAGQCLQLEGVGQV